MCYLSPSGKIGTHIVTCNESPTNNEPPPIAATATIGDREPG